MIKNIGIIEQVRLWNGLLCYYKFNESSGNASDSINGTILTNSNVTYSTGKNNNAAVFGSSSGTLVAADNTVYDFEYNQSYTWSFWINRSATGTVNIFGKRTGSPAYKGYHIYIINPGTIQFEMNSNNDTSSFIDVKDYVSTLTSTGVWYHVVVTYNGNGTAQGAKIYVNGVGGNETYSNGAGALGSISNTGIWALAYESTWMKATLDEFCVWNRVLREDEIKALYSAGNGKFY